MNCLFGDNFYLDTLRFYQALRMCGTDFTLISRVFPNRDRDDIKRKFKTEDKANRTLVDSALRKNKIMFIFLYYSIFKVNEYHLI
jgi:transcription factor TFIIIB component B''